MVNRTDVRGRHLSRPQRKGESNAANNAITAPFRQERGNVFLSLSSLEKHFKTRDVGVLGVHSASADLTLRWLAMDIDLHDPDELSVTAPGNFAAAKFWRRSGWRGTRLKWTKSASTSRRRQAT